MARTAKLWLIPQATILMADFLVRALLGGVAIALVAGPMGAFVVWRRMAYFGAAMAHTALLGVALGLLLEIHVTLAIMTVCVIAALALSGRRRRSTLPDDTLLGIVAHGALALGLVVIAFQETLRIDLLAYLFGASSAAAPPSPIRGMAGRTNGTRRSSVATVPRGRDVAGGEEGIAVVLWERRSVDGAERKSKPWWAAFQSRRAMRAGQVVRPSGRSAARR